MAVNVASLVIGLGPAVAAAATIAVRPSASDPDPMPGRLAEVDPNALFTQIGLVVAAVVVTVNLVAICAKKKPPPPQKKKKPKPAQEITTFEAGIPKVKNQNDSFAVDYDEHDEDDAPDCENRNLFAVLKILPSPFCPPLSPQTNPALARMRQSSRHAPVRL